MASPEASSIVREQRMSSLMDTAHKLLSSPVLSDELRAVRYVTSLLAFEDYYHATRPNGVIDETKVIELSEKLAKTEPQVLKVDQIIFLTEIDWIMENDRIQSDSFEQKLAKEVEFADEGDDDSLDFYIDWIDRFHSGVGWF